MASSVPDFGVSAMAAARRHLDEYERQMKEDPTRKDSWPYLIDADREMQAAKQEGKDITELDQRLLSLCRYRT